MEGLKPKYHFCPPKGWINDPNGLVYHEGKYHMFYQHYPDGLVWGPMHWGHAASGDLINWEHKPVALYPEGDIMAFSGSAVSDKENLSGLKQDGKIPLVLMYTSHGTEETQSLAYSFDGINFLQHSDNPVIENPGISDFRDPKIFYNPDAQSWHMVLAAKDRAFFYATRDFVAWEKTGEFGPDGNYAGGVWECPDMIAMEHNGQRVWVLIVSMTTTEAEGRSFTQYFLGDFDGAGFICNHPFSGVERLDEGFDNYAGVSFNNINEPVLIGWATNWGYADKVPATDYRGSMTLPRKLSLKNTRDGLRLSSQVISAFENRLYAIDKLPEEIFVLKIRGEAAAAFRVSNDMGEYFEFGVDKANCLFFDRSNAGEKSFSDFFASGFCSKRRCKRLYDGTYEMELIFDVSIAELFIDNGTRVMTMEVFPHKPYSRIESFGNAEVEIYKIN